jgi:hypothetical protein
MVAAAAMEKKCSASMMLVMRAIDAICNTLSPLRLPAGAVPELTDIRNIKLNGSTSGDVDPDRAKAARALLRQIFVEERRQLAEVLLCLGRVRIARILRMRLALEHVKVRNDAGLTQLAMHAHRVGQEQVTRA